MIHYRKKITENLGRCQCTLKLFSSTQTSKFTWQKHGFSKNNQKNAYSYFFVRLEYLSPFQTTSPFRNAYSLHAIIYYAFAKWWNKANSQNDITNGASAKNSKKKTNKNGIIGICFQISRLISRYNYSRVKKRMDQTLCFFRFG